MRVAALFLFAGIRTLAQFGSTGSFMSSYLIRHIDLLSSRLSNFAMVDVFAQDFSARHQRFSMSRTWNFFADVAG